MGSCIIPSSPHLYGKIAFLYNLAGRKQLESSGHAPRPATGPLLQCDTNRRTVVMPLRRPSPSCLPASHRHHHRASLCSPPCAAVSSHLPMRPRASHHRRSPSCFPMLRRLSPSCLPAPHRRSSSSLLYRPPSCSIMPPHLPALPRETHRLHSPS